MSKNEKFVHFLESLVTEETKSLIESIYNGFEIITEANRAEQGMNPQQVMQNRNQKRTSAPVAAPGGNQQMAANARNRSNIAYRNAEQGMEDNRNANNSELTADGNYSTNNQVREQRGNTALAQRDSRLNTSQAANNAANTAASNNNPSTNAQTAKNNSGANSSYEAGQLAKLGFNQQQINSIISIFKN